MANDESRNKRSSEDDMEDGEGDRRSKRQRHHDYDSIESDVRLLLPSRNAGAVIGKGGENVKRLRATFHASISLPDSQGPERLLSIRGTIGKICEIVSEVIPTLERVDKEEELEECDVRMLIHQSQAGLIIGKGGTRVKELREDTGAQIRVFTECCPQSTDRLCQLTGKPSQVVHAMGRILDLMDTSPTKGVVILYDPNNFDEMLARDYGGFNDMRGPGGRGGGPPGRDGGFGGRDRFDRGSDRRGGRGGRDFGGRGGRDFDRGGRDFDHGGRDFDRGGRDLDRGGRDFGGRGGNFGGPRGGFDRMGGGGGGGFGFGGGASFGGFGGGRMGAERTESSQVSIPKTLAGAIIGKGGTRIRQVQVESGTTIKMDDGSGSSDERIITITGTQEQIQYAQYLLQMTVKQYANV